MRSAPIWDPRTSTASQSAFCRALLTWHLFSLVLLAHGRQASVVPLEHGAQSSSFVLRCQLALVILLHHRERSLHGHTLCYCMGYGGIVEVSPDSQCDLHSHGNSSPSGACCTLGTAQSSGWHWQSGRKNTSTHPFHHWSRGGQLILWICCGVRCVALRIRVALPVPAFTTTTSACRAASQHSASYQGSEHRCRGEAVVSACTIAARRRRPVCSRRCIPQAARPDPARRSRSAPRHPAAAAEAAAPEAAQAGRPVAGAEAAAAPVLHLHLPSHAPPQPIRAQAPPSEHAGSARPQRQATR